MLEYKGYKAKISALICPFHAKIVSEDVYFEGLSYDELVVKFHRLVDEYIENKRWHCSR